MPATQKRFEDIAIVLHPNDSVAVLKRSLKAGDELVNGSVILRISQNIGAGHKIALTQLSDSEPVRKYGQIIGFAKGGIAPGEHVPTHNLAMRDFGRDYQFSTDVKP